MMKSRLRLTGWLSPRAHRGIDLLTFPALLAAAAVLAGRDRRAAAVVLATAAVEGVATATTDYPPPVFRGLISFRAHNAWAAAHGLLVAGLAAWMPGLTPLGRRALGVLSVMPITMALVSDTSRAGSQGPTTSSRRGARPGEPTEARLAGPPESARPSGRGRLAPAAERSVPTV
jgi:hypothetical protein